MRLQIEPTGRIIKVNGTECRAWRGVAPDGTQCVLFIAAVSVMEGQPGMDAFNAALRELPHPGREADAILFEFATDKR